MSRKGRGTGVGVYDLTTTKQFTGLLLLLLRAEQERLFLRPGRACVSNGLIVRDLSTLLFY